MYNRDWRNEKDYEYTESLSRERWAWEFLRRNLKYIIEWEKTLTKFNKKIIAVNTKKIKQLSNILDHGKDDYVTIYTYRVKIKASELDSKTKKAFSRRREYLIDYNDGKIVPERIDFEGAREKWGFLRDEIINPNIDNPTLKYDPSLPVTSEDDFSDGVYYTIFRHFGLCYDKDDIKILSEIKDLEIVIKFDLSKPIQQQLEHYKKMLEGYQKEFFEKTGEKISKTKMEPKYWKVYLRVLDGVAAKTKVKEIAQVIFPGIDNEYPDFRADNRVRDTLEQARRFVDDKGYLRILYEPSKMKKR